ncbi:MAG: aminotransferase class V-fold PLP-dependent enzyme [Acidobacteriota bacterium]|nr:aminotransferase class V-fold PLP-dependent enzyme [Acidobacteriota bacterium]
MNPSIGPSPGTWPWDMLFYSVPLRQGDVILTSRAEYVSNYLAFLHRGRRCGVVVEVVPDDETGQLSLEAMEKMIDARRFENWESYVAGRVGLAATVDYALAVGIGNIRLRVQALARASVHYYNTEDEIERFCCELASA